MKLKLPLKRDGKLCIFRGNPVQYLCKEPKQSRLRIFFYPFFPNQKVFLFITESYFSFYLSWTYRVFTVSSSFYRTGASIFDKNQKNSMH